MVTQLLRCRRLGVSAVVMTFCLRCFQGPRPARPPPKATKATKATKAPKKCKCHRCGVVSFRPDLRARSAMLRLR